jgi:IS6 family transposase
VLLSEQRDTAARRFFTLALAHGLAPVEVVTDKAGPYPRVLDQLAPAAAHVTERYANNRIEADHGRLKARLRPMRGLKRFRTASAIDTARRSTARTGKLIIREDDDIGEPSVTVVLDTRRSVLAGAAFEGAPST